MSKFKITNGFPNVNGKGNQLIGESLDCTIKIGDRLVIDEDIKIPIIEVELVPTIASSKMIMITIPRVYDNTCVWHLLYGKEFEIEGVEKSAE